MAVNTERFVAGHSPYHKFTEVRDDPQARISDFEAAWVIKEKIEGVIGEGKKRFKMFRTLGDTHSSLFTLTDSDAGSIYMNGFDLSGLKVDRDDLQRVGLAVMEKFGLNKSVFEEESSTSPEGTVRQIRVYQSKNDERLKFKRILDYKQGQGTEDPMYVEWNVRYEF